MNIGVNIKTWIGSALVSVVLAILIATPISFAQSKRIHFDHNKTHFPLYGAHAREQCDSCHSKGIFKGTPKLCVSCHIKGSQTATTYAPDKHVPTRDSCDLCHNAASWAPARMSHNNVTSGSCVSCHNGVYLSEGAIGRPIDHAMRAGLPDGQTDKCDLCHKSTTKWTAAVHRHGAGDFGQCSKCHNGSAATGMMRGHIPMPAGDNCDTCHTNFIAFGPAHMSHSGTDGKCATCHNGAYLSSAAQGAPATILTTTGSKVTHNPSGSTCDSAGCHESAKTKNYTTWVTTWDHSQVLPAVVVGDHTCATCHKSGGGALATSPGHIPFGSTACDSCHNNFSSFIPSQMDHSAVTTQACTACHNGNFTASNAQAKASKHIPDSITGKTWTCDNCHNNFKAFQPALMDHTGTANQCATCHNGGFVSENAQTKPVTHLTTKAQCDACHKSTTSWTTVSIDHSLFSPPTLIGDHSCVNCHNGSTVVSGVKPVSKPTTHIPTNTSQFCDDCHLNFSAFKPGLMDHSKAGTCTTCHNGSYLFVNALAQSSSPTLHIPTGQDCVACHTDSSYKSFVVNPDTINSQIHVGSAGRCATCHSGNYTGSNAQTKSAKHVPTNSQCDTCHKGNKTWATVTVDHNQFTPTPVIGAHVVSGTDSCASCHTLGGSGLPPPGNHVPTDATVIPAAIDQACDNCHTSFSAFAPGSMANHAGVKKDPGKGLSDNCSKCHNGNFVGVNALAKTVTHIQTAQECDACHAGFTTFANGQFNHATSMGTKKCADCHDGAQAKGKTPNHVPTTAACDLCHTQAASGGYTTWIPGHMQASQHNSTVAPTAKIGDGTCSQCHNGSFLSVNAQAKPANHVATTAACDSCHKDATFTTWTGAVYTHSASDAGKCVSCHYTGGPALGQNATHIPIGSISCDNCHTNYSYFAPAAMNHTGLTGACYVCHSGANYNFVQARAMTMADAPMPHVPTTTECYQCHSTSSFKSFYPAKMNHAGTSGTCYTCHNGSYLASLANAAPATILTSAGTSVSHTTSTTCDSAGCHTSTSNFTSWVTTWSHSAAGISPTDPNCQRCHSATGGGLAPSAQHAGWLAKAATSGITTNCSTCHKSFISFLPATMTHSGVTSGSCANCHDGSYASLNILGKPVVHVTTTAACDTCHTNTANYTSWVNASFNHATIVVKASCGQGGCHDGAKALGKPVTHIPTTLQANQNACDDCHTTTSYAAGTFSAWTMNHATVQASLKSAINVCSNCHGTAGLSKYPSVTAQSANHVATTTTACDNCHTSLVAWTAWSMDHNSVNTTGGTKCNSCHYAGGTGKYQQAGHIPTTAECASCHDNSAPNYISFTGGITHMNHNVVASATCASCHGPGTTYSGVTTMVSPPHVPTSQPCTLCHTNTTTYLSFLGSGNEKMDHTGTAGQCSTCHGGTFKSQGWQYGGALGKADAVPTHQVTSGQCDSCHNKSMTYTTWVGTAGKPDHSLYVRSSQNCVTGCHTPGGSSPVNLTTFTAGPHITTPSVTSGKCGVCHVPTAATFGPAVMDHSTDGLTPPTPTIRCDFCHGDTTFAGSGAQTHTGTTHQVTIKGSGQDCGQCHNSTVTWSTGAFTHTIANANCSTCHVAGNTVGAISPTFPPHIPITSAAFTTVPQCSACHTNPIGLTAGSYSFTANVRMNHTGAASCSTCHNGSYTSQIGTLGTGALGSASFANHIPYGASQCSRCHTNPGVSFAKTSGGMTMDHTAVVATCSTCHNNLAYATSNAQMYTSVPAVATLHTGGTSKVSSVECSVCHGVQYTSWVGGLYHKSASTVTASGTCLTCHNGSFASYNAQWTGTIANHIPYASYIFGMTSSTGCDTCHTTSVTSWATEKMNHNGTRGAGTGGDSKPCTNCHLKGGASYLGNMQKNTLHKSGGVDCSDSKCHAPLGKTGKAYSSWGG